MRAGTQRDTQDGPLSSLAVAADVDRFRWLFVGFVAVGIVLALVLGIREVVVEPVVQLDEVRGSDVTVRPVQAQALARNTSDDTTYCVEVTITAADRDGLTLRSMVATPTSGDGSLAPGRSANFVAVFDDLTDQELAEELSDFFGFVTSAEEC